MIEEQGLGKCYVMCIVSLAISYLLFFGGYYNSCTIDTTSRTFFVVTAHTTTDPMCRALSPSPCVAHDLRVNVSHFYGHGAQQIFCGPFSHVFLPK